MNGSNRENVIKSTTLMISVMEAKLGNGISAIIPDDFGRNDMMGFVVERKSGGDGGLDVFEHIFVILSKTITLSFRLRSP